MKKILVIEDEPEMRRNISALLRYHDYEAIAAENGREGIEMARRKNPHAMAMLGFNPERRDSDRKLLGDLLAPQASPPMQTAALNRLSRLGDDGVAILMTAGWKSHSPSLRGQILDANPRVGDASSSM